MATHWSQRLCADNPRGYRDSQLQKIADATDGLQVELAFLRDRLRKERSLVAPIDDEYGADKIEAMIAEVEAERDARMRR
jgi:hypothetical protein